MLTAILQKIIILLVGLLFAFSAGTIFFRLKNVNHTERIQIFKTAEYFNAWIILICFVTTMLYGIFNHLELKNSVHAIVALNYSEASGALNSNGTRYNMAEIISDEVVERAIKKGALEKVTVKVFRDYVGFLSRAEGMNSIAAIQKQDQERIHAIRSLILDISF